MNGNRIPDYCFWCGEPLPDGEEICADCLNRAVYEPVQHPPLDTSGAYDFGEYVCDHCNGLIRNPLAPCIHCGHKGYG